MFAFEKEQLIFRIGDFEIGGSPGEHPTVLAGTIFYGGHKIVSDHLKGTFDKNAAKSLILAQDEMASLTGNPAIVQIFAESDEAMRSYIEFVTETTEVPIIIDSTDSQVRLAGLQYAEEIGLLDKAIYNSLNISIKPEEIEALKGITPDSAIVLAFNPQDPSVAGRRAVLEQPYRDSKMGLIDLAKQLGISKPLIDTAATSMGAGAGSAVAFTFVAKTLYGLPTGSGIHNAPASWPWLKKYKKQNRDAYEICDIASSLLIHSMGADFVLYGPIDNAKKTFPVVAMADVFSAEAVKLELGIEPSEGHPFKRLL